MTVAGSLGRRLIVVAFAVLFLGVSVTYWTQEWPAALSTDDPVVLAKKTVHLDGVYYYAYLRSLALDRDLDFDNDYALLGDPLPTKKVPQTGRRANVFTIGPAILWSPFFAAARGLAALSPRWGPPDGTGERFQQLVFFGSTVYGLLACLLTYLVTRRFTRRADALLAALTALFATPLFWHMTRQASYSHAISAFLSALLILTWLRNVGGLAFRRWFGLGLLCGLGMSVRVASVAHALVPASELLPALVMAARRRDARALRPPLIALFALAAGALIGFLPQMLAWKTLYGAYLTTPQGPGFMHWSGSRYGAVLFSTWNGWAAWHPLVSVGLLGLAITVCRRRADATLRLLAGAALLVVAAEAYFNGATDDWWGGWAFGGRRFTDCTVYVAIGVGQLFSLLGDETLHASVARALRFAIPVAVAACFTFFSLHLAHQHLVMQVSLWNPVHLGEAWKRAIVGAFDALYASIGNVGSIPDSWSYAIQAKVPPARYDDADLGADRKLEVPWFFREPSVGLYGFGGNVPFMGVEGRWLPGSEGRFGFSLRDASADLRARIELAARRPGTRVTLSLAGETVYEGEPALTLQPIELVLPAHLLSVGRNIVHVQQTIPREEPHTIGSTGVTLNHDVAAHSAAWGFGEAGIMVGDTPVPVGSPGISLVTIDPSGHATHVGTYNTAVYPKSVERFAKAIESLPSRTIAAVVIAGEASTHFSARGDDALKLLGGSRSLIGVPRASYALIGVKGAPVGSVLESFSQTAAVVARLSGPPRATIWHSLTLSLKDPPAPPPPPAPAPPADQRP